MESLEDQLGKAINRYVRLARRNYVFAYSLVVGTILSSGTAGIGGMTTQLTPLQAGILALVPALASVVAFFLKPQGRANWHYRKAGRLIALRRQLTNEHADPADISKEWRAVDEMMDADWEKNFGLDASTIPSAGRPSISN